MTGSGPRVLVVSASRHGSTHEIAGAPARYLAESMARPAGGLVAAAVPAEHHPDPAHFDAVVLGSAVYAGKWLQPARDFATTHAAPLRKRPVWLFSSGPIGDPPFPPDEPYDAPTISTLLGARGHRVFPGRLDEARLTFGERHGDCHACTRGRLPGLGHGARLGRGDRRRAGRPSRARPPGAAPG